MEEFKGERERERGKERWIIDFDHAADRNSFVNPSILAFPGFHQVAADWNISNSNMAAGTVPGETMSKITEREGT